MIPKKQDGDGSNDKLKAKNKIMVAQSTIYFTVYDFNTPIQQGCKTQE